MSERENKTPSGATSRVLRCDEWENLITDALDSTLAPAEEAAFTRHHSECALCAQMFKETQQGKDWMQYLAVEPESPAGLLEKILARTSERPAGTTGAPDPSGTLPPAPPALGPVRTRGSRLFAFALGAQWAHHMGRQILEPRLMMTLAMAFFSITLTLNLTGIHLTQIRPADLQPSRLRATLTRQYYSTNEQVTKYYENLRVVYEMESRVRELRRSSETAPAPSVTPSSRQPEGAAPPSSTAPRNEQPQPQGRRSDGESPVALPAGYHRLQGEGVRPGNGVPHIFRAFLFRASPAAPESQAKRSVV